MALSGTLTDLPLADLMHLLASNQLSGRLTLTNSSGHGMIVFRHGKIIYAATNGARETFGSMLVHRKIVSPSTLVEALETQARSPSERRLGNILLEMGAVDEATLASLMHQQVERVIQELLTWRHGFVRFEQLDIAERGEVEVDAQDFLIHEGLATDRVMFDIMSRMAAEATDDEDKLLLDALASGRPPVPAGGPPRGSSLKSIMAEIRCPQFTGELTLKILSFAGRLLSRGALFLHASGNVSGIGQYGFDNDGEAGPVEERVRAIRIPSGEPSIFHDVIERRETYLGPLEKRYWNVKLARDLGGEIPEQVAVVPLLVGDQVRMMLYGDNQPGNEPIGRLDELELVMLQAGLAVEKGLLERRLRELTGDGSPFDGDAAAG